MMMRQGSMETHGEMTVMPGTGTEVRQEMYDRLRAFIARRVSNQAEVEDITQEVFLRIHRRIEGLKDPHRLLSWVYQITRRVIIDHYRASAGRRELPAGLAADMEMTVRTAAALIVDGQADSGRLRGELAGCLSPMLNRLSKESRDAIMLVDLEGLTHQVAAQRLGLSLSGMKSRVQRGRRQLKQMLNDCCLIELDGRRAVVDYDLRDPADNPCRDSATGDRIPPG